MDQYHQESPSKLSRVRTVFKLRVYGAGCTQTQRESDEGRASTTGERIKDPGDRREPCCADVKALRGSSPLSKGRRL
jgi:hypothetical protein